MFAIIVKIIPFVFFGIPLLFIFGLFVSGAFTLFFTPESDRGRDVIARALTYFLILLAVFLVFVLVSYLVQRGAIFSPKEEQGSEFPMSPMGTFPKAPDFVVIAGHSFSGPWPIAQYDIIDESYVYGIFCKKDQDYDIIDLGISSKNKPISSSENYECWQEQCSSADNIYIGFYWTPPNVAYSDREAFNDIKADVDFVCNPKL
jgi:hypothetical protein